MLTKQAPMETDYCRELLNQELNQRKSKNTAYSMRAFARDLGIGSTSLSECLSNKRKLSKTNIANVVKSLQLSPLQFERMLSESSRAKIKPEFDQDELNRVQLAEDNFRMISDWYYIAIMNLAKLNGIPADPMTIGERLGISSDEALTALNRLVRLDYIKIVDGFLQRTSQPLSTSPDVPSTAVKKYHIDNLRLAEKTLWNIDVHLRDFSAITMPVDTSKLPEVKNLLMKTKRKIAKLLSQGSASEVYTLCFQLFPVTQPQGKK